MISQDYFLSKVSKLAHMKLITIPIVTAKDIYDQFSEFENSDLDGAIEDLIFSDDRFDFIKLRKRIVHSRASRLEGESRQNHLSEAQGAERFFDVSKYTGECKRTACRGCPHSGICQIRGREWIKNINAILNKRLGENGANEVIRYMQKEFMGGIK